MENFNIGIVNLLVSTKLKEAYFKGTLIEESKNVTSEFLNVVKSSPYLQLEFRVFNSIEGKHIESEVLAKDYIDDQIDLFEVYTIQEIDAERAKLKPFISETILPDDDRVNLYQAIDSLINETLEIHERKDIDKMHESVVTVLEHVRTPKKSLLENVDAKLINEEVIEIAVGKFNEKYADLNETDKDLLKTLIKSTDSDKKSLLETMKTETITILESIDKDGTKEYLEKAIQKINEMVYTKENVDDNIIGLHELKKELV
jgi:hypothetical protein